MIIIDSSVWIDYLNIDDNHVVELLEKQLVLKHPHIIGELSCGNIKNRSEFFNLIDKLPKAVVARESEARLFIEEKALMGKGIGYTDVHILASTALSDNALLWTRDKRLSRAADELGLLYRYLN